ncbi:MAG: dynamin family protein [Thermoguttaceae bacterium]|nr:dynamin family protein [Thermoguttaceae bacterium]
MPEKLPTGLTQEASRHISQYRGKVVPPIEIDPDQLEHYVVITDPSRDQSDSIKESPFDHAEIFWPLDLCKNQIEIIDSPGLDENESRSRVTNEYLSNADVILFVQTCAALAGETELKYVNNTLKVMGLDNIIYICNRFDELEKYEDCDCEECCKTYMCTRSDIPKNKCARKDIIQHGREVLGNETELGKEDGVFFISAKNAMNGRRFKNNPAKDLADAQKLIEFSGIQKLEDFLAKYLFENKGRIKIKTPARRLHQEIIALKKIIDQTMEAQQQSLEDLRSRADKAHQSAQKATEKVENFMVRFDKKGDALVHEAGRRVGFFFQSDLPNKIQNQIFSYELSSSSKDEIIEELKDKLGAVTEDMYAQWIRDEYKPFVLGRMQEILEDIDNDISDIIEDINQIQVNISGHNIDPSSIQSESGVSGLERLLTGAGGFLLGGPLGPLGAAVGATLGVKGAAISFVSGLAGWTLASTLLGIANPLFFLAGMLGGGIFSYKQQQKLQAMKIKEEVIRIYKEELRNNSPDIVNQFEEKIKEGVQKIYESLNQSMRGRIQSVLDFADNAVQEKEKGEKESLEAMAKYKEAGENLGRSDSELMDIISSL